MVACALRASQQQLLGSPCCAAAPAPCVPKAPVGLGTGSSRAAASLCGEVTALGSTEASKAPNSVPSCHCLVSVSPSPVPAGRLPCPLPSVCMLHPLPPAPGPALPLSPAPGSFCHPSSVAKQKKFPLHIPRFPLRAAKGGRCHPALAPRSQDPFSPCCRCRLRAAWLPALCH